MLTWPLVNIVKILITLKKINNNNQFVHNTIKAKVNG